MKEQKEMWKMLGKIGFIGAGKVGCTLGLYWQQHGIPISGYYSQHLTSAKEAAQFTNSVAYESLKAVITGSDTLFLTVPDGQIKEVWDCMQELDVDMTGKVVCHASGSLSSDIFSGKKNKEVAGFSVHPLCAISDKRHSYEQLGQCMFTVEGANKERREQLIALLKHCENVVEVILPEKKPLYHAAAVVASNFTVGLAYLGMKMLLDCGFSREHAEQALLPLMQGSMDNIARQGSVMALTGPVERGDISTVKKHLQAFAQQKENAAVSLDTAQLTGVYKAMTSVLVEVAKEKQNDYDDSRWKGEIEQ